MFDRPIGQVINVDPGICQKLRLPGVLEKPIEDWRTLLDEIFYLVSIHRESKNNNFVLNVSFSLSFIMENPDIYLSWYFS